MCVYLWGLRKTGESMTAGCKAAVGALLQGVHATKSIAGNTYSICIAQHASRRHGVAGHQVSKSYPASLSSMAATAESTPPETATATGPLDVFVFCNPNRGGCWGLMSLQEV